MNSSHNHTRKPSHCRMALAALLFVLLGFIFTTPGAAQDCQTNFLLAFGSPGTGNGQFNAPQSVAVDSSGNIYVADTGNHRIEKFDSSGNFLFAFGSFGTGNGQFFYPFGVAVDSSGNVYVAENGNERIQKFDSSGNFLFAFGSPGTGNGQFNSPQGVAVDSSGNIYVADVGNNRIQKFDSSGNFLLKFGSPGTGNGQFFLPTGVAVDSSGNIYVADAGNNRIQKFDSAGNFLLKFGSPGTGNGQFSAPQGLAVDSSGNIYVADTNNSRIQKFDSAGNFLLKFGTTGTGNGQFFFPFGVAVDASGNVYVADTGNNRIEKFGCGVFGVMDPAVSDQKAGSVLVFPYYTSTVDGKASDTLIQISNVCNGASVSGGLPNYSYLHLFFMKDCSPADTYACITPNGSLQILASVYDPGVTGYLIAVAVNAAGIPVQNNCFIGSAYVRDDVNSIADSYGAEAFRSNLVNTRGGAGLAPVSGGSASINLNGADYDAAPTQFSAQVQDPSIADESIVLASINGNLGTALSATSQSGVGLLYRADEAPASFQPQIGTGCFSTTLLDKSKLRIVPGNYNSFLKDSYGYLKFNVTSPAVGLLISKQGASVNYPANRFAGIRTLHKTQIGAATLTAPIFPPFCVF